MRAAPPHTTVVITSPFLAMNLLYAAGCSPECAHVFVSGPGALSLLVILKSAVTKNLSGIVGRGFNRDIA
jgi:hypothetical protein